MDSVERRKFILNKYCVPTKLHHITRQWNDNTLLGGGMPFTSKVKSSPQFAK